MKVLDAFCGAGGFGLGFAHAGCEVVGGIEIDKWAAETFQANHQDAIVIKDDITGVSDGVLRRKFRGRRPDIIIGGPPCQGFSHCVSNAGDPKDPRNSLFKQLIRLGKIFKPEIIVLENVQAITRAKTAQGTPVVSIIKDELESLGYFTHDAVLEGTDFGVPQIRKRLFVVATRKKIDQAFPQPTHIAVSRNAKAPTLWDLESFDESEGRQLTPTLWEAISDLPQIKAREGSQEMPYDAEAQNAFQERMRNNCTAVFNHKAMNHSARMVERFESMSWGQSTSDVPHHLRPIKRNSGNQISETVYDQNNRRMHPDKPCHTIAASFYANFVHPYVHRNFTPREGARIQTFPDNYIFHGKPTVVSHKLLAREGRDAEKYLCQYNQIGNAVPPMLAEAIAKNLLIQVH